MMRGFEQKAKESADADRIRTVAPGSDTGEPSTFVQSHDEILGTTTEREIGQSA
jgi:hypothetical protein